MSAVVRVVKAVVAPVFKVVQTIGKVVTQTVQAVGKVVESVANTVGKAVESIAKIAKPMLENQAIALALSAAIPGVSVLARQAIAAGLGTLVRGGRPEDALKAAATTAVIGNVQDSVYKSAIGLKDAAGKAVFTTTQAAAAASAASSAVASAAAGGNLEDVLKGAAIGGTAGAAATAVMNETQSRGLANFTRAAVVTALQKQQLDQIILQGASAATVGFLQQIQEEQKRADTVLSQRDSQYSQYQQKVSEYNSLTDRYNASTSQAQADDLKRQLDAKLAEINNLSNSIGQLNQRLADMQGTVNELTKKAQAEAEKTGGDYSQQIVADLQESEQALLARIQEASSREFGDTAGRIELAQYQGQTATDVPLRIDIAGLGQTIYEDDRVSINEYGSMFDAKTGEFIGDLTQDQLFQLRERLGLPNVQGPTIGEGPAFGAEEQGGTSTVPSGVDRDLINAGVQDLILQQEFYRQQVEGARQELGRLQDIRSQAEEALRTATPATQAQFQAELDRIDNEISRVQAIENQATTAADNAAQEQQQLESELETRTGTEAQSALQAAEEAMISRGRSERVSRATQVRFEREMEAFDKELAALEDRLSSAESDAAASAARKEFVTAQRETLRQAGRLPGDLEQQIQSELEDILDSYETSQSRAGRAVTQREQIGAARQTAEEARTGGEITDEDVIRLLGLEGSEAERYGFLGEGEALPEGEAALTPVPEEPTPEEAPAEGEMELGGGEGEGAPTRFDAQGKPIFSTVVEGGGSRITSGGTRVSQEGIPGISSRVTGEALTGILGEKEPIFGGDEDQQRAVWNRRSLRLRRALGL